MAGLSYRHRPSRHLPRHRSVHNALLRRGSGAHSLVSRGGRGGLGRGGRLHPVMRREGLPGRQGSCGGGGIDVQRLIPPGFL